MCFSACKYEEKIGVSGRGRGWGVSPKCKWAKMLVAATALKSQNKTCPEMELKKFKLMESA